MSSDAKPEATAVSADKGPDGVPIVPPPPYKLFDPAKTEYIKADWLTFFEMLERRDLHVLDANFGGFDGIVDLVKADPTKGISTATYQQRLDQFGPNEMDQKEPVTFWEFLVEALSDKIVIILIIAAIVSIIFGVTLPDPHTGESHAETGWTEGLALVISVIIVVSVGSIQNYTKAKKFEAMEKEQTVRDWEVIRDGKKVSVKSNEVVVGDLLKMDYGMEILCDGIVTESSDLKTNESTLTGEPDLVDKERGHFVISGTTVEEGSGFCLILALGMDSQQGRSKKSVEQESKDTPLQEHLEDLADQIGKFGLGAAIILIVGLSIKEIVLITTQGKYASPVSFLNFLLIAVAVVAVAIPEGLPLAVTIALAFSMNAMMEDQCMVRVLASCETMGAATAVCSDKTGTLTKNEMTTVQLLLADEEVMVDGVGLVARAGAAVRVVPHSAKLQLTTKARTVDLFAESIALNSSASQNMVEGELRWVGNKTDQGMLRLLPLVDKDYVAIRAQFGAKNTRQFPFNSAKKRMTTLVRQAEGHVSLYTKGASETILENCHMYRNAAGDDVPITDAKRKELEAIIKDMACQGNRTIGLAFAQSIPMAGETFPKDEPEDDVPLVFLGICGIQDPIRPEVPDAIDKCHTAWLTVRMLTGDNIDTAKAIGKKCHLYNDDGFDVAMTGPQFRQMYKEKPDELLELLPRLKIIARCSPTDKLTLVELLQKLGEVVGVTGDGTNDAPALKAANVGFAMKTGTDIAKSASHMILLDDNFASVVNAIKWGRVVNDNIRRFLQFQLAINIAGVALTVIGSFVSKTSKEPFTPVQLLWLNLIMDTLAALSLATERPSDDCLTRRPVYASAPLIPNRLRSFIAVHGLFQFTLMLAIILDGHNWFNTIDAPDKCDFSFPPLQRNLTFTNTTTNVTTFRLDYYEDPRFTACAKDCKAVGGVLQADRICQQGRIHSTMIFNIFILFQVFNVINARKLYGEWNPFEGVLTRSQNLIFIFILIGGLQAIMVEFTRDFMGVTGLSARNWGICIGFGALELIVGAIVRALPIQNIIPDDVLEKEAKIAALREKYTRTSPPFPQPTAEEAKH